MPPRLPSVQGAMASVNRRIRIPRRARQCSAETAAVPRASPFVSPVVKDLHAQIFSSLAGAPKIAEEGVAASLSLFPLEPAASQASPAKCCDLSHTLHTFLKKGQVETVPNPPLVREISRGRGIKEHTLCGQTEDVLLRYNPTLDSTIVRRVAKSVDIEGALQRARDVLRAIQNGGDFGIILSGLRELHTQPTMQEVELEVGIAARLHQGRNGWRQWRARGFRLYTSDVQVAEVLPSGKIVSFTDPTLPSAASLHCNDLAESEGPLHLHFVLYKEGLSLGEAFNLLSEACEGMCRPVDFAANVALEESAVTVQVCSVFVVPHHTTSYGVYRAAVLRKLLQVNLKPIRLSVQVLAWRSFPCDPLNSHKCQMQYSILVRGITPTAAAAKISHAGLSRLEEKALASFALFPNFFGPHHFGPISCPFRTHHALAAWERNMPAEALVIAACLGPDVATIVASDWVGKLVDLLRSGEDRPAVLKEWCQLHIPPRLKAQIASSKNALLWNVLASCRIRELGGGTVERSPEPGDFVLRRDRAIRSEGMVAKMELFPESSLGDVFTGVRERSNSDNDADPLNDVVPILTREEALPYTLSDVVIPLNIRGNKVMEQLSILLGFRASSRKLEQPSRSQVHFRQLFAAGSGHPRATSPWVKTLPVPGGDAVYKLLTDIELRQHVSYTATSKGQSYRVWPIGRYGYRMAERLPAGAVSLAASDTVRHCPRCLALHFTLPFHTYSMALFRELMVIEDHSASAPRLSGTRSQSKPRWTTVGRKGEDNDNNGVNAGGGPSAAAASTPHPRPRHHNDDDDESEFTDGNIMRKRI